VRWERAQRSAGIVSNKIDAPPSNRGISVVSVKSVRAESVRAETVRGETVVERLRRLVEHLRAISRSTSGRAQRDCLRGCLEPMQRWTNGASWPTARLSA